MFHLAHTLTTLLSVLLEKLSYLVAIVSFNSTTTSLSVISYVIAIFVPKKLYLRKY